jgi:hypothetical protein
MTKHAAKEKSERGFFAAKSVVSKRGATMRVIKLELTPKASDRLKADSQGIRSGVEPKVPQELANVD